MPALVHTLLQTGGFRVTEDSGVVRDSDALFATAAQKIIYRGTLNGLLAKFPVGLKSNANSVSSLGVGEALMLCAGPENIRLRNGTQNDPHWEAEIKWVGLHKKLHGIGEGTDYVFRAEAEFGRTETEWPKEQRQLPGATGAETIFGLPSPFVSNPPLIASGMPKRCRVIAFVPTYNVIGVIVDTAPLSPLHPKIMLILQSLKLESALTTGQHTLMKKWWPVAQGTTGVPDPIWVWAAGFMEGGGDTGDTWVPQSLQVRRQLSVGALQAFTMGVAFEQRVQPG